jgi:geranylgeranyl pyrophosphate synthase
LELANEADTETLMGLYSAEIDAERKITEVKKLFQKYKVDHLLLEQIETYTLSAFKNVERLALEEPKKQVLIDFGRSLMKRKK